MEVGSSCADALLGVWHRPEENEYDVEIQVKGQKHWLKCRNLSDVEEIKKHFDDGGDNAG